MAAGGSGESEWKAEAEKLSSELAQTIADNTKLAAQLEQKTATVTDLSARIDELARNQNAKADESFQYGSGGASEPAHRRSASPTPGEHRLKRENQNAGSGDRVR